MTERENLGLERQVRPRPGRSLSAFETVVCAVAVAGLVFWGFSPSYYLRFLSTTDPLSPLLHVHGLAMSAWVVAFVVQALLIVKRRGDLHRRFARFASIAFVAAWLSAAFVAWAMVQRERFSADSWTFFANPLCDLAGCAILVASALFARRRRDWHGRLMIYGSLAMLVPAVSRIQFGVEGAMQPVIASALVSLLGALLFVVDSWRGRRIHPAMAIGIVVLLSSVWLRGPFAASKLWQELRPATKSDVAAWDVQQASRYDGFSGMND